MPQVSRRTLLFGSGASVAASTVGACVPQQPISGSVAAVPSAPPPEPVLEQQARGTAMHEGQVVGSAAYGPVPGEPFPVPAAPLSRINPAFLRTRVAYASSHKPGTIVADPAARYLYFVEEGGRAMRYGVGVGKEGFAWSGTAVIHDKQEWPDWYPPKEMIQRRPDLRPQLTEPQSGIGVPGGPSNPHGGACHVPVARQQGHAVSHPRHQRAQDHRHERLLGLHPHDQSGCHRPLRADCDGDECCRPINPVSSHRMRIWPKALA